MNRSSLLLCAFLAGCGKGGGKDNENNDMGVSTDAAVIGDAGGDQGVDDFPAVPTTPGLHALDFIHDGAPRTLLVYLPADYTHTDTRPLFVALHGGGGSAQQMFDQHGLAEAADETGYIFVAAQGLPKPGGGGNEWNGYLAFDNGGDDVGYLERLFLGLSAGLKIDPTRRYLAGFSGGATMTVRFATEKSELLAAIGTFAGKVGRSTDDSPDNFVFPPAPTTPLAVQMVYGTEDGNYDGELKDGILSTGGRVGLEWWADTLGCGATPTTAPMGRITLDTWTGCEGGVVVQMVTVDGMGHTWPDKGDETNLDGTKLQLDFFEGKVKP
jgi:polyhydroxybutyrate depolymerase